MDAIVKFEDKYGDLIDKRSYFGYTKKYVTKDAKEHNLHAYRIIIHWKDGTMDCWTRHGSLWFNTY